MVEKQARIEVVGEIDVEAQIAFADGAQDGLRWVRRFVVLVAAFLLFARFEDRVLRSELQGGFGGFEHGFEPNGFFARVFFVGAFEEGDDGVCFFGGVGGELVDVDAEGDFGDVAVVDAIGVDAVAFHALLKVLSAFGQAVLKHLGLALCFRAEIGRCEHRNLGQ